MKNLFLLTQSGMSPDVTSSEVFQKRGTLHRKSRNSLDSIVSRFSLVSLICVFMLTLGVGNAWGAAATLPVDYTFGDDSYPTGCTGNSLTLQGYAASHGNYRLKFDGTGDYLQIQTDAAAQQIIFSVKMIGGNNNSSFQITGSADGSSYSNVGSAFTISGSTNDIVNCTTSVSINSTYRYFRLVFTKGSNVGFGTLKISKASSCDKKVTITKGTPETGGSFSLDKTGEQDCCDALTVTVSGITAPSGKKFSAITQSGIASGVTIDQSAKTVTYAANSNGSSTINVTFEDKGCTDHNGTNVVSGASTSYSYGPVNPYYEYSTREILYTKTDLNLASGKKGTIKSIYFEYAYASAMTGTNSVKIYMANTALTALSTSNYVTSFTEVYDGPMNCSNGWNEITLTTPFAYNGVGNLIVIIDDNSNKDEGTSPVFKYHTASTTTGAQIYTQSSSTNADPTASATWTSSTAVNYRPNTKFCIQEADMSKSTVTFVTGTGNPSVASRTEADFGSGITLPSTSDLTPRCSGDGWVLYGWATASCASTSSAPSLVGLAGATYYPSDNITLYAVYRQTSVAAEASTVTYTLTGNWTTDNGNWTVLDGALDGSLASGKYGLNSGSTSASSPVSITDISSISFAGTKSGSGAGTVAFYYGSGDSWTLIESKSFNTSLSWSISPTVTGQLKCVFTRSNGNIYMASIGVTGKFPTYTYNSNPSCCEDLGTINGSFNLTPLNPHKTFCISTI